MTAASPLPALVAVASVGLAMSIVSGSSGAMGTICGALGSVPLADLPLLLGPGWSAAPLAVGWMLMLVAMMPPLLGEPVANVCLSSLPRRRIGALALFASAYTSVWLAAGLLLIPVAVLAILVLPPNTALAAALALCLLWSASPAAQTARNRCHRRYRIGAAGVAADRDCLLHGWRTGLACCAACWPWMLLPLTAGSLHAVAMGAVIPVLFWERILPPETPRWKLPPVLEAWRLLTLQNVSGRL